MVYNAFHLIYYSQDGLTEYRDYQKTTEGNSVVFVIDVNTFQYQPKANFLGWSTSPNSSTAQYFGKESVTLTTSNNEMKLYAAYSKQVIVESSESRTYSMEINRQTVFNVTAVKGAYGFIERLVGSAGSVAISGGFVQITNHSGNAAGISNEKFIYYYGSSSSQVTNAITYTVTINVNENFYYGMWFQSTYPTATNMPDSIDIISATGGPRNITIPSNIPKSDDIHFIFKGWKDANTGTIYQPGSVYGFNLPTTVTMRAEWLRLFSCTFTKEGNGGVFPPDNLKWINEYPLSTEVTFVATIGNATPVRDGYEFMGWDTVDAAATVVYRNGDKLTVDNSDYVKFYAVWREIGIDETFVLHYDANGGTESPQDQTYTGNETIHEFSISSSMPSKPDMLFWGWGYSANSKSPEYYPEFGIRVSPGVTVLYAMYRPIEKESNITDRVTLYKSIDGPSIDISDRLTSRSRITEAENYGKTATFTVSNNLENPEKNLLSSSCNRWSSGTGALTTGMFVTIHGGSANMCDRKGVFFITGMDTDGDTIKITCGDALQILRATGADYYRNHYGAKYDKAKKLSIWDATNEKLYINKPSDVTLIGGSVGDVKHSTPHTSKRALGGANNAGTYNEITSSIYLGSDEGESRIDGIVGIKSFTIDVNKGNFTGKRYFKIKLYSGENTSGKIIGEWDKTTSSSSWETISCELSSYVDLSEYSHITIWIKYDTSIEYYYTLNVKFGTDESTSVLRYSDDNVMRITVNGSSIVSTLDVLKYENASGKEDPTDAKKWIVESLSDGTRVDSGLISPFNRAWIEYLKTGSGQNMNDVLSNIVLGAGFSPFCISSTTKVDMFRCGGDYFHNYLLALADMEETEGSRSGRQHSIAASPYAWDKILLGYRHKSSDQAREIMYYAGDGIPSVTGNKTPMMSFAPSKTMQYRPSLAITKGAKNDGSPIMIAIRDPTVKIGSAVSILDSSASAVTDAALSSYSAIITNRSKDWEGTVTLSGIHDRFMELGTYIGGIPIRIYDSRYGMNGYQARIKECTLDYEDLTTTLTLNNYSIVYSNSSIDTSKMAYTAGSVAMAATSEDLYTRQFVFLDGKNLSPNTLNYMQLLIDGVWSAQAKSDFVKYPELGIGTFVAYFAPGSDFSENQYAVTAIRVNDSEAIPINIYRRPDKRRNQYLIVNVQLTL